jgi:hypothetical protein
MKIIPTPISYKSALQTNREISSTTYEVPRKHTSYVTITLGFHSVYGSLQPLHWTAYNLTLQLGH